MSEPAAVRWPSYGDLCDEYTTTPERCSHCGHRLRPLDPSPVEVPRNPAVPPPMPFADVAREARATHHTVLAELASWALAYGRRSPSTSTAVRTSVASSPGRSSSPSQRERMERWDRDDLDDASPLRSV